MSHPPSSSVHVFEIIISVHKPYMYPIVIWFRQQKWQISLKSAQVDYPLISKAHALRVPHNCRCVWGGRSAQLTLNQENRTDLLPQCHPHPLIKSALDPGFFPRVPLPIVFCLIDVDWGHLSPCRGSRHSAQGAKCLHAFIWLYPGVLWPNPGLSCAWAD